MLAPADIETDFEAFLRQPALTLSLIARAAGMAKSVSQFPKLRDLTLDALSTGTPLHISPTDHIAELNKPYDAEIRLLLWQAKYRAVRRPRDPMRLFANADVLAGQLTVDSALLDFLYNKSRMTRLTAAKWKRRLFRAFAIQTLIRDNKWSSDVCYSLVDRASAEAVRTALAPEAGTLFLVAHVGFLQICFAFVEQLFANPYYVGGRGIRSNPVKRNRDPRAELFAGLRSLTDGNAVLIAPDGGFGGSRYSISVLGRPTTIGSGAAFLAYETGCQTKWLNADIQGDRFSISIEAGPQREASETYRDFTARLSLFYETMLNHRMTGAPENIAVGKGWIQHLQRATLKQSHTTPSGQT